jgi:hypothetical protein
MPEPLTFSCEDAAPHVSRTITRAFGATLLYPLSRLVSVAPRSPGPRAPSAGAVTGGTGRSYVADQAQPGSHQTDPPRVEGRPPFWTSLPGILTGVAALITAMVGAAALVLTTTNSPPPRPEPTSSAPEDPQDTPPAETTAPPTSVEATIAAGGYGYVGYVFASPSLSSPKVGEVPHGTTVFIVCTAYGDSVASPDGSVTTAVWDFIRPSGPVSVGGYVADTWVFTGTNDPTMPVCD